MRDGMPVVGMGGTVAGAGSSLMTIGSGANAAGAGGRGWGGRAAADLRTLVAARSLGFFTFSVELERAMGVNETKRWKEEMTGDRW